MRRTRVQAGLLLAAGAMSLGLGFLTYQQWVDAPWKRPAGGRSERIATRVVCECNREPGVSAGCPSRTLEVRRRLLRLTSKTICQPIAATARDRSSNRSQIPCWGAPQAPKPTGPRTTRGHNILRPWAAAGWPMSQGQPSVSPSATGHLLRMSRSAWVSVRTTLSGKSFKISSGTSLSTMMSWSLSA